MAHASTLDSPVSAGEVGGIFAGIVSLVIAIGGGIRWLVGWNDRRQDLREAKLNKWEESLQRREKAAREEAEAREAEYHQITDRRLKSMEQKAALMFALNLQVVSELERLDAGSPVLVKVRLAIKEAFAADPDLPEWFGTLYRQFEEKDGGQ